METNGQTPGADRADIGPAPGDHRTGTGQGWAWCRVADLYPQLAADPRTVRRWIARNVPNDAQERREGGDGGAAEVYLRADYLAPLRAVYSTGQAPGDHRATTGPASDSDRTGTGQTPGAAGDQADGWREALAAERGRTAAAVAEADHLRSELERERVARQAAARHAEEAERGRHVAETRGEALRAAWWQWYALLTSRAFWRVRRLPTVPPELTAGPALPPPEGEARWRR